MQTRALGRLSDVRLSEISLGTWGLASGAYGKVEPSCYEAVIKRAWEAGITTFDVAPLWGEGESEWRTAAALGDDLSKAVFVSRAGQSKEGGRILGRFDSQSLIDEVEGSLRRLGRDSIDVLLLHNPPLKVLRSDLYRKGVDHLVETGKIRSWGASVVSAEAGRAALEAGAHALGIAHHALDPHVLRELDAALSGAGAGVLVRSPLCYGLLAGRWSADTKFDKDDHRSRRWDTASFAERLRQVEELGFLVKGDVPDLATGALRFALSSRHVTSVAVGARTVEQVTSAASASAAEGKTSALGDEDLALLAERVTPRA